MADQITLPAESRPGNGKGEARALRSQGRVPAIAYGADMDTTAVHVDARELRMALTTDAGVNAIISLEIDGDKHLTMAREIHRHPVRRDVLHLDFVAFDRKQKVTVEVPLVIHGEGPEGAIVSQPLNYMTIEVLPLEVPETIEASIEGMEVGDVLRAGDIALPEGVDLIDDPERTAVSITLPDAEPEEETETAEGEEVAEGEAAEGAEGEEAAEGAEGGEE